MKVFAIDYDDTYTADPDLFDEFISLAKRRGHLVVCVTFRAPSDALERDVGVEVFYTSGVMKAEFMSSQGLIPNIWIDDMPHIIGKAIL